MVGAALLAKMTPPNSAEAKGWKGLCQKVDVPPKCATGWYAGATTSTVGFHMDKDTAGFGDEGCGGGSTAWKTYWPGAAGAYCCERAPDITPRRRRRIKMGAWSGPPRRQANSGPNDRPMEKLDINR